MAVPTFDASSSATANSTGLTLSHTCTGSDRLLVVNVIVRDSTAVNGVTYGGVSMTRGPDKQHTSDTLRVVQFYLPNPASGANNIVVTLAGSTTHRVDAVSYTGAAQASPLNASNTADGTGTTTSVSVTTTVADCIVVDGFIHESPDLATAGAGQTFRQRHDEASWSNGSSEEPAATAATVSMDWSGFSNDTWVAVAGGYKATGGAAATILSPVQLVGASAAAHRAASY
jgi:hypothetical protein